MVSVSKILSTHQARGVFLFICAVLILVMSWCRAFEHYELRTFDLRLQMRGERPQSPNIVFIDIWDDTLNALSQWPISREYHAFLVKILREYGARTIIFDIEFVEPSQIGKNEKDIDAEFADEIRKAGNVFLGFGFKQPLPMPSGNVASEIQAPVLPLLEAAARGVGFVNTAVDMDGKWRRMFPVIQYDGKNYYQLAIIAAMDYLGTKPAEANYVPFKHLELKKGHRIPLDDKDCAIISYAGKWDETFHHKSYVDILVSYAQVQSGEKPIIDLDYFKGKICIVGLVAQGTHDMKPTPLQPIYPGVGVYANVINSVITDEHIRRMDREWNMVLLALLSAFLARIAFYKKPLISFLYALSLISVFILAVINIFIYYGLWMDLFYPTFIMAVVYTFGTLTRIITEMRKRELMESELKIASQIQKSFLPAAPPEQKGLGLSVFMQPAKHVGGDLYAFLKLPDDKVGVMLGDVSGKGTPAALFMGKVVSEFKYAARDRLDPSEVLTQLNNSIASESTGGLFVTLVYAIFDMKNMKITVSNGGHLPVVVTHPDDRAELLSVDSGMPIGVMEGVPFANFEMSIVPGQSFALYSDGISEARNRKKEEFGVEALQKAMLETAKKIPQDILDHSVEKVKQFAGKAEQHDDMTLIIAQVTGNST